MTSNRKYSKYIYLYSNYNKTERQMLNEHQYDKFIIFFAGCLTEDNCHISKQKWGTPEFHWNAELHFGSSSGEYIKSTLKWSYDIQTQQHCIPLYTIH